MTETFNDITASPMGAAVFVSPLDCLLVGFDDETVQSATPPDCIELKFSARALVDCHLIAEYSAGAGIWKPLALADTTDGASSDGVINYQIPSGWAKTTSWDGVNDIPGAGPLYWVRLQRRGDEIANSGAVIESLKVTNRPYLVAKRATDTAYFDFTEAHVGSTIYFRFVPIGRDGKEYPEQDVRISHTIQGYAFNPGNAS